MQIKKKGETVAKKEEKEDKQFFLFCINKQLGHKLYPEYSLVFTTR